MKTKKFFSIALSLILLITSNSAVFANSTTSLQISRFADEIQDIEIRLFDVQQKIANMGTYKQITTQKMVKDLQKELYEIGDNYFRVAREMHFKSAGLSKVTTKINPADKSLIHNVSYAYNNSEEIYKLWDNAGGEVNNIIANMATVDRRLLVGELEEYVKSMESLITTDLHSRFVLINGERESLFKALEQVTQDMPKEDIYKMIFNTLDESDRAGINLIIQAREDAPSARKLAKGIQSYLKQIGKAKPGFINRLKLIRDLKRFSKNVDGRIEYVSKVTRLDPLEVEVGKGMVKTERGLSSMLKSVAPLIVVGVVLTAATIVDVNAQNVFPKSANPRRMHNIKKAIENDQDVSVSDALDFYIGHFDENESVIENSNAHYMNMVRFLVLAQQANNDKAKIFNAMESLDPEVSGTNFSATTEVSNAFDMYMENNPVEQVLSQEELI